MANVLIPKHGSGAPGNGVLKPNELGVDTQNRKIYIGGVGTSAPPIPLGGDEVLQTVFVSPTGPILPYSVDALWFNPSDKSLVFNMANGEEQYSIDISTLTGTLGLAHGGTGATDAATARTNLGLGNLATLNSISLASTVYLTGTLPVSKGGTGKTSWTANRLLYASATTTLSQISNASGALYNTGTTTAPSFGTLPIAQGGTGATTASEGLANLGGLPLSGGTMVASGAANGRITIPGLNSGWIGARDKAGIIVTNGGDYTPALSMKSTNCTWDIATYGDNLEITKFSDTNYNAGSNVPTREFTFREDGIIGLQSTKLLANGSLSNGGSLSGSANLALYRTIYILFGESLNGANQYYSFTCPFVADQWGIYLPAAGDYYRAKVVISSAGQVTVSMLSSVTRFCFIYACL